MTVGEIISRVERSRPGCSVSLDDFLFEINKIYKEIYDNIISRHEGAGEFVKLSCENDTLFLPDPFVDLIKYRLMAMLDLENGDTTRYSNNMIVYNNLLLEYSDWYTRFHMPKQNARLRWN